MTQPTGGIAERRKSKGSDLYQRINGTHYQSVGTNERHLFNGRNGNSRVSPSPGRHTTIAYSPCPLADPDVINIVGNVLAIPLSAIQTNTTATATATATAASGWSVFHASFIIQMTALLFLFRFPSWYQLCSARTFI